MKYRALFVGGPLDGQERVTQYSVSEVRIKADCSIDRMPDFWKYRLLFTYGEKTLVYSTFDTSATLDLLFERYMNVQV